MTLINKETEYEERGLKVNVNHTLRSTGYSTDSIYYEGNKKVKHIYNSDYNGTITVEISEYDEQGKYNKENNKISDGRQIIKLLVEYKHIYIYIIYRLLHLYFKQIMFVCFTIF